MRLEERRFAAADGQDLAYHLAMSDDGGAGRPLLLIHGLFSNAQVNWVKFGHAALLTAAGFRLVMPDLRGHGASRVDDPPPAYPPDVLASDMESLIDALGLEPGGYDLAGFSLGGRTVARLLARGCSPRTAVIAGMGLKGITDGRSRVDWFLDVIARRTEVERGSDEWLAVQFMKSTGAQPETCAAVLEAHVDTPRSALEALELPVGVVCGAEDRDNGSAHELAGLLPRGSYREVPGTHMSSVAKPELGRAIADFLAA